MFDNSKKKTHIFDNSKKKNICSTIRRKNKYVQQFKEKKYMFDNSKKKIYV